MSHLDPAEACTELGHDDEPDHGLEMLGGLLVALAVAIAVIGAVTLATCFF